MDTRRSFLKKAGLLTGGAGFVNALPPTLQKAFAINPAPGTHWYDAEHVIFLMQENRSFDHALGMLQGVRGFNDPRAIQLPNRNKVWLQSNARGETFAPFPFDMHGSNITWQGGLPHGWSDQVDARNGGRYDRWLEAKDPGGANAGKPYTLGYFGRNDIPFYYALADCFTVCDHNFCSSLTGTTPNRLFFWTGTIRDKQDPSGQAKVHNHNADHGGGIVRWKTYPERLEEQGISWKVYQNELYLDVGLGDKQPWLDNFGDNPLEYVEQYHARMHPEYIRWLPGKIDALAQDIATNERKLSAQHLSDPEKDGLRKAIGRKKKRLAELKQELQDFTPEQWEKLTDFHKSIHRKAFDTNRSDPYYHELTTLSYFDGQAQRRIDIPKGDILKNFRDDVLQGKLPAVSWIAAPEQFSDHPSRAWFGAWYVSEVMDILTQRPEVWKKCILVLTYDENDGYFDHLPPYAPPSPYERETGKVSAGIDTSIEHVRKQEQSDADTPWMRESNIGLGYRVPMIIASPWSRGGYVCSEVFDHTSSLQFLEKFLEKKTGKRIVEENISEWRRTVCGDLTSAFRPYHEEAVQQPAFLDRDKFVQGINNAKFASDPVGFRPLRKEEIAIVNQRGVKSGLLPVQEKGIRDACPLPYELYSHGILSDDRKSFTIDLAAGSDMFGPASSGAPFYVYMHNLKQTAARNHRDYAVKAGDQLRDVWALHSFEQEVYDLQVYGPNGFYRAFRGSAEDPLLDLRCSYPLSSEGKPTGNIELEIRSRESTPLSVMLADESYGSPSRKLVLQPHARERIVLNLEKQFGWYDFSIIVQGNARFRQQFAGHVETAEVSKTDPLMGGVL